MERKPNESVSESVRERARSGPYEWVSARLSGSVGSGCSGGGGGWRRQRPAASWSVPSSKLGHRQSIE